MSFATVAVDEAGIATLVVNRPEVINALDVPTAHALRDAAVSLLDRHDVRCIVLRGAGRGFVSGGDVAGFAADFDKAPGVLDQLLDAMHPAIDALSRHAAPVIGAVHGVAAGAGISLLAACDLVVAAEGTRFLMAYDKVGAPPDSGGTWTLARRLGPRLATEFFMLGEPWDCAKALSTGLINRIVPIDQFDTEVAALAARIASGPTQAYGLWKRLQRSALRLDLNDQMEAERVAFKEAMATDDFREGITAFLEKRKANYTGK